MEPGLVLFAVAGALISTIAFVATRGAARARAEVRQRAAQVAGLTDVQSEHDSLQGRSGPLSVRLKSFNRGRGNRGTRIWITSEGPALADFTFRLETLGTGIEKVMGTREIDLGDAAFDEVTFFHGPDEPALAVLDSETRAEVARLLQHHKARVWLAGKCLHCELSESLPGDDTVVAVLPQLLAVARRLVVASPEIPQRLADNAQRDPVATVRLNNLRLLIQRHRRTTEAEAALRACLCDPAEEVRLEAAMASGKEGRDPLFKLAREASSDARGARAVAALGDGLSFEEANDLLSQALSNERLGTAKNCIEVIGRIRHPGAVRVLRPILEGGSEELAVGAAQALGATRDPAAEAALVDALKGRPFRVVEAAARALGRIGSTAAVLALRETSARRWIADAVHMASRQAIAEIQSRASGASPGQLSLATDEAGQVSLAEDEAKRGQVSLVPKDPA